MANPHSQMTGLQYSSTSLLTFLTNDTNRLDNISSFLNSRESLCESHIKLIHARVLEPNSPTRATMAHFVASTHTYIHRLESSQRSQTLLLEVRGCLTKDKALLTQRQSRRHNKNKNIPLFPVQPTRKRFAGGSGPLCSSLLPSKLRISSTVSAGGESSTSSNS